MVNKFEDIAIDGIRENLTTNSKPNAKNHSTNATDVDKILEDEDTNRRNSVCSFPIYGCIFIGKILRVNLSAQPLRSLESHIELTYFAN